MSDEKDPEQRQQSVAAKHGRRIAAALAKSVVSAGLLWALFSIYDVGAAFRRIAAIDPLWIIAAFAAFAATVFVAAARWRVVLRTLGVKVSVISLSVLVIIAVFFNQTLPSNLGGDAMRVWRLFRRGAGLQRAIGSVLLDHVVSVVGLALLVLIALPWVMNLIADKAIVVALVLMVVAILIGLGVLLLLDRAAPFMTRMLPAWLLPARLLEVVMQLSADARTVFLRRRVVVPLLLLAVGTHLVAVMTMVALAYGLGITVDFGAFVVLVPPAVLASLVPLSFAGWGVREGAMVALLGSIGIVPEEALALSVAFGVLYLIGSLPGGILWLVTGNRAQSNAANGAEGEGRG
jgi:uncharacterized protein (TIRG00374 family)